MFRTLARLGKIRVGAVGERMGVTMRELAIHGIIPSLLALVGFERTLAAVGIVFQVIGSMA
jgi:hypothetical protein